MKMFCSRTILLNFSTCCINRKWNPDFSSENYKAHFELQCASIHEILRFFMVGNEMFPVREMEEGLYPSWWTLAPSPTHSLDLPQCMWHIYDSSTCPEEPWSQHRLSGRDRETRQEKVTEWRFKLLLSLWPKKLTEAELVLIVRCLKRC